MKYSETFKQISFGLGISCLLFSGCQKEKETERNSSKPNVLIIYTDDQGSIDVNCYGANDLHTPNMDKIAETGVKFTQFYAAGSVSSPSRAALMTGKTPQAAGLPGNAPHKKGEPGGMPTEQVTIAEIMKDAGYVTGHIGKWHMGYTKPTMPNQQGFDYSFGHMGGCIDNYSHFYYWRGPNRHDLWKNGEEVWHDGEYFPDLMVDEIDRFMERNKQEPFFLYWAINVPHYPYQGTEKWREHYSDLPSPRNKYAAFVSTMDEYIGMVLDKLKAKGLRDNTIVIFQSDQGHDEHIRAFSGGGDNGPYRGAKISLFEGGIRIPAMISWKNGEIPQGVVRDQMAVNVDWLPTIADLCDIPKRKEDIAGKSLLDVIYNDDPSPHHVFHWKSRGQWAVRMGKWKLLSNPIDPTRGKREEWSFKKDTMFLIDLEQDKGEMNNLINDYPEKVAKMKSLHNEWINSLK